MSVTGLDRRTHMQIRRQEFHERLLRIQQLLDEQKLDVLIVYGDEYRKEQLRYVSNYWPIFERGAAVIARRGEAILLAAPEGEEVAKEMSAWSDIRLVKDFACVTVPEDIDYPLAQYTSFRNIRDELEGKGPLRRLGIVGMDAMSATVYWALEEAFTRIEIIDANSILTGLRLLKSPAEVACLKESARIADVGYEALMAACTPGNTELQAAAAGEAAARAAGAEQIVFVVMGTGRRTNTIVGRPTSKVIEPGDMVMAALAVMYEGYVTTVEWPFVAGGQSTPTQRNFIDALVRAEELALPFLRPHRPAREFVRAVKGHFRERGLNQYDLYPPMHGCGLAEAESPYPDENSPMVYLPGMTVNTDISLFGHPEAGSNRIEEGFVVTETGYEPLSPLVRRLSAEWQAVHSRG
jgi:Xaa-Pro aminopeptidase